MALIKRTDLASLMEGDSTIPPSQVFLFFGERFLCKESANEIQEWLLKTCPGSVHTIDGDREDPGQTLARLMSYSLLPGRQIYRVTDSRIFHTKTVLSAMWGKAAQSFASGRPNPARRHLQSMFQAAGIKAEGPTPLTEIQSSEWKKIFGFDKPPENLEWADQLIRESEDTRKAHGAELVDRFIESFDKGLPTGNILILTTETIDKRQRLFTYLKKYCTVIDCSVTPGAGMAAQKEQKEVLKEMMLKTLEDFQKKIEPRAMDLLFERVGFHPVAMVMETEKLAHFVGKKPTINCDDLAEIVGRSREDALYELTDAFSKKQAGRTLTILNRLLEQGIHALAILSTMRNYLRKHLIYRSLQMRSSPLWRTGMNAREFQNNYLPALKKTGEWEEQLKGHPYALFMSFTKASEYSCSILKRWMSMLLKAEFRLKGSPLPQQLVLEELFLSMLKQRPKAP